jgi:hypothetical protein
MAVLPAQVDLGRGYRSTIRGLVRKNRNASPRYGADVILVSVGLPGRLAEWCDAVLAHLAGGIGGKVSVFTWPPLANMLGYHEITPTLDQVGISLLERDAEHLVVGARQPDEHLRSALLSAGARYVVALDDPRVAACDILGSVDVDLKAATRAIANSCPFVMRYASSPGALAIRRNRPDLAATEAVAAIASHFEFRLADDQARHVVEALETQGVRFPSTPNDDAMTRHKMVEGALSAYAEWFAGGDLPQIVWQRDLFAVNGGSGNGLTDVLDVQGGIRTLIFGPYIHVPAGSWLARAVLGFSPEAAGHTFYVDVYSGGQTALAHRTFQPMKAGVYTVDIDFSIDEPAGLGLEVRVFVWDEFARGQLAFGHVMLRPLAMRQPDVISGSQEDFRTVLGL